MPRLRPRLARRSAASSAALGLLKLPQTGSHVVMRRDAKGCVVPMHSELKVGTLAGILRQADVTPEEFIEALRK